MTTAELQAAADRLEDVLCCAPQSISSYYQYVVERHGHLWAIATSDAFEGMSACNRQQWIWDHLNKFGAAEDLQLLDGVTCYTRNEYDDIAWLAESRRRFSDYVEGPNGTDA